MRDATVWELSLFVLAIIGTIGASIHVMEARKDYEYIRDETNGDLAAHARRTLIMLGSARDAWITMAMQVSVLVVATTYVNEPTLGGRPTSGPVWIIRGTLVAIEALLILQMLRRRLERKRLVEMIVESEEDKE